MYYTRYLVPFLSVAAIFTMSTLNIRKKIKTFITVPVFALCMCIFIPTNISLRSNRDDTNCLGKSWIPLSSLSTITMR